MQTIENISPEQRAALAAAAQVMNAKLDEIVERVQRGEGAEVTLPAAAADNPALAAEPPSFKDRAAKQNEQKLPERPVLSDEQIFEKVSVFLDPTLIGPIFISEPIRRKIFVAKYPTFGEMLSAERLLGPKPKPKQGDVIDDDDTLSRLYEIVTELQQVVLGWTFDGDPALELVRQHPGEPAKWQHKLRKYDTMATRDPRVQLEVPLLWKQYALWKYMVTPTDDELEKYYGLIS